MIEFIEGVLHALIVRCEQTSMRVKRKPHRETHGKGDWFDAASRIDLQNRPSPAIIVRCSLVLRIVTPQSHVQIP
jgi:hypothetical protein